MRDGLKVTVLAVVVMALLLTLGFAWASRRRADALANGPGELQQVVHAPGPAPLLVALETLEFSPEDGPDETVWQLTTYDAATGARLARTPGVPWTRCAAASAGLLWCATAQSELAVLTLPSLAVKHAPEAVARQVGQKLMDAAHLKVTDQGALVSLLADGRKVALDAQTLATTPASAPTSSPPPFRDGPFADLQDCRVDDGAKRGLCRTDDGGERRVDRGPGWLKPTRLPIDAVPGRFFLLVDSSLDEAAATRDLVALDEQLAVAVRLPLVPARSTLDLAGLAAPGVLALSFRGPNVTVGVDVATGAERYRIRH